MRRVGMLAVLGIGLLLPAAATATRAKSALEGQPAVRHRHEVRKNRFEIGPEVTFSLNRMLRHAILAGAKLEYHITDWLSLGAAVGYGFGMDTGLSSEIAPKYTNDPPPWDSPATGASWQQVKNRFADIKLAGDVRLAFTPFAGKMGVFQKIFFGYDFYIFGGFGFAMTQNKGSSAVDFGVPNTNEYNIDASNEGFRMGAAFGLGLHLFFTRFFSMGFEIKDLVFSDNEPGGDITHGLKSDEVAAKKALINGDDRKFGNHLFVGLNFTFFFPLTVEISP